MTEVPEPLEGFFLNTATVAGVISKYGVKTSFQENGAQRSGFAIEVREVGYDQKIRSIYLDVTAWGKAAEAAGELEPGAPVLIEGKLARTQRTKKGQTEGEWYTTVQATRVQRLDAA
jgi:single-stranded DNA-binding protein